MAPRLQVIENLAKLVVIATGGDGTPGDGVVLAYAGADGRGIETDPTRAIAWLGMGGMVSGDFTSTIAVWPKGPYAAAVMSDRAIAYYRFDEGDAVTGTNITDVTGYSTYHSMGTSGSALFHEAGALADGNYAMKYTGGSSATPSALAAELDFAEAISCEAWVKVPVANHYGGVVTKTVAAGSTAAFMMFVWNGVIYWRVYKDGTNYGQLNTSVLNLNQWYHAVGTYDGFTLKLYLNGALVGSTLFQGPLYKGAGSVQVANNAGITVNPSNMWIDEVALYPLELSAARVLYHYQQAARTSESFTIHFVKNAYVSKVTADSPSTYWRLQDGYVTTVVGNTIAGAPNATIERGVVAAICGPIGAQSAMRFDGGAYYAKRVIADGAASYWRLGETSGTTAVDSIGGAKNGTISASGVTLAQAGAVQDGNTAMAFNGTTGRISMAAIPVQISATIEAWVKQAAPTTQQPFFSNRGVAGSVVYVGLSSGKAFLYDNGAGAHVGSRVISDGAWHHIVFVLTSTSCTSYIDGTFDATTSWTRSAGPFTGGPGYIGYDVDTTNSWNGSIDEVAIYNYALAASAITAHYNLGLTVVGPASGGNVYAPTGAYQTFGTTSCSLECWARLVSVPISTQCLIDMALGGGYTAGIQLRLTPTDFQALVLDGTSLNVATYAGVAAAASDKQWRHFVVVVDRTAALLRLYINGVQVASAAITVGSCSSTQGTTIGTYQYRADWFFNGEISEVAAYKTGLTPTQIQNHYNLPYVFYTAKPLKLDIRPYPDAILEMEFFGKKNGWGIVRDWLQKPGIQFHRGLPGQTVTDLVADIGTMSFTLNNSETNSAGTVGYYSPDHVDKRYGLYLNIGVRFRIGENVRFTGTLSALDPLPGKWGARTVSAEVVDWMSVADRTRLSNLPVLINKRGEEVFQTLIDSLPITAKPDAVEKDVTVDTFPYTLDRTRDEQTVLRDEIYRVCTSGMYRCYMRGDGTVVFENRTRRATAFTSVDTFSDSKSFSATHDRSTVVNRVQMTIHPRLPSATDVVMYSLAQPIEVTAGVTATVLGPWTDPNNKDVRVGAVSLVSLLSGTDYIANTLADGTGTDITSGLTVVAGLSGNATSFTITSNTTGFITKLQQRGKPLYDYGASVLQWEDANSISQFGITSAQIDMPYSADAKLALEIAQFSVYNGSFPLTSISGFTRMVSLSNMAERDRSILRLISDRINIIDQVTGLSDPYFINAIDENVSENVLTTQWTLVPADTTGYWFLEVPGRSELDQTTRLGFGQILGHTDIAHQDVHQDVAHVDVAHIDTHTDVPHQDVAHVDNPGVHGDTAHADVIHTDVTHQDAAAYIDHQDTAHGDWPHNDSHTDSAHTDVAHVDTHNDGHNDQPAVNFGDHVDCNSVGGHLDCWSTPYGADSNPYGAIHTDTSGTHDDQSVHWDFVHNDAYYNSHGDSHGDSAHGDGHTDSTHNDVPHSDYHGDSPHSDVAHQDVVHQDIPHSDAVGHSDSAHIDVTHQDVAHQDISHSDGGPHYDSHIDVPHGDLN